ncbi:unnamed protein product [Closterium sp. NIES-53]
MTCTQNDVHPRVEAAAAAVEAAAAVVEVAAAVVLVEVEPHSVEALVVASASSSRVPVRPRRPSSFVSGTLGVGDLGVLVPALTFFAPAGAGDLLKQNVVIFDLDFDAILAAMYALTDSAEGDCYLCVPPNTGIEAAALGASESAAPGTSESVPPGARVSALSGNAPTEALHTFTLDSGASRSFFRNSTTLTPLSRSVAISVADPSGGPVLGHSSTVLPYPAAPSGLLSGLHLPSFSTNLVSGTDLRDVWVDQFTPEGQHVIHCTCTRTGRHLATFTRQPGSSLYAPTTASPPVTASGQVAASCQVSAGPSRSSPASAPCSCRPLSHKTLLWHQRLGHPSLPHLRGMASRTLVSGLPRSLPPLPPGPAPTCVPCVEGRQRAAPHSSSFLPTEAPLQTLHMDVWGPARVRGQGHERYFLLVVDNYSRYTTVFPLRSKGETEVRRIGMVMDVARTSMIHAAAPHFLWSFAVQYAAHQINLQPRVSLPETTPTLRWTGKVGDAFVFRVWGSQAFVRDTSASKLSSRNVPCVFLGFPPDAAGWQFYHPTSRRVLSSHDVTFDESVDPVEPVEVVVDSGAARGAEPASTGPGGAEPGVAETEGAEPGGAEPGGTEPGGAESGGAEPRGAESGGAEPGGAQPERAEFGGPPGVPSRREPLSPQRLCEWYAWRCSCASGATGPATGSASGAGAAGGAAGAGAAGGAGAGGTGAVGGPTGVGAAGGAGAAGPGGARTGGTGAACAGGAAGVGAVGTGAVATQGAAGAGAAGGAGAGGAAGVVAGDPGAEGTSAVSAVSRGAARPRPYDVPLLQQVLGLPPSTGPTPPLLSPPPPGSRPALPESRPASPESCPESPVRAVRTGRRRVPLPSPPASSLPDDPDPESDSLRTASPTVTRFLSTVVTDPSFESTVASALVAELVDFVAACCLDYATSLVAESESASEEFECFGIALAHLVSMLLAPEGDPDAPDIPTPRSYTEAIEGPYSSQWQTAMDTEMASWKSTGTYVDEVPPPGANIISGMWIFKGVYFFHTFSPTPKMTTLWVLLHVAAQRDYELHSLDFSTAFLQGSLHDEMWLCRPPGFTGSFPAGTQWSLRRPVYGLRQAPREWHDTLRTTLAALGFPPSTADPSLFLRTDTTLPSFYVLVYVDDLVFATADTEALAHVKSELQKRHTCTDLGELTSYLGLRITRDRAQRTITLTQSHMVRQDPPVFCCAPPHHFDGGSAQSSLRFLLRPLSWKVGDASVFRVWGSRAFVRDLSADKLSPRAVPCVFLGFPPDAPRWQFYHPTSRRFLSSQDVTFDESVPYYRLFPYRTAPLPPPPLFLVPGPPPVDPLPPQGPAPSGVSQVDAVEPVEVAVDSGAGSGGAEPGCLFCFALLCFA